MRFANCEKNDNMSHSIKYDKEKFKVWTWKNPAMLHWIINPGIAFNELVLGQRAPKVTFIEKNSTKTLAERTLIPCPHCGTLHSALKWTPQNKTAFKNWFGLYCDNCGKIIPCVRNLTSFVILCLTVPVWFWFKDKWKAKWLEVQRVKFSKPLNLTYSESKKQWWRAGVVFGLLMYLFMTILAPLVSRGYVTQRELLIGIPVWAIAGFLFVLIMKVINRMIH